MSLKNEYLLKKMYFHSGHSRWRWVCLFVGTNLEKFSIASLAHQWILCGEWVPSELESKQLIKHHNNPQVIHSQSIDFGGIGEKQCVWNKSIKAFFHSIAFSSEKLIVRIRREICTDQAPFTSKNSPQFYLHMSVDFEVRGQQGMDFYTGGNAIIDFRIIYCPEVTV